MSSTSHHQHPLILSFSATTQIKQLTVITTVLPVHHQHPLILSFSATTQIKQLTVITTVLPVVLAGVIPHAILQLGLNGGSNIDNTELIPSKEDTSTICPGTNANRGPILL
ncbi:hypothetical protein PM082_006681 [Marasmius tenuissimus]|nr:hypothetical protein PM082_006681 [Marasmius tenuissimus]